MDINHSIAILNTLANGVDPTSGEVFPRESVYNHPEIIRALYNCLEVLKHPAKKGKRTPQEKQQDNINRGLPRNAGMIWTEENKAALAEQFNAAIMPADLATRFERTKASIIAQLKSQGLITEEESRHY